MFDECGDDCRKAWESMEEARVHLSNLRQFYEHIGAPGYRSAAASSCLHPDMETIPTEGAPSWYAMTKCGSCGRVFEHEETGGWTEVIP